MIFDAGKSTTPVLVLDDADDSLVDELLLEVRLLELLDRLDAELELDDKEVSCDWELEDKEDD